MCSLGMVRFKGNNNCMQVGQCKRTLILEIKNKLFHKLKAQNHNFS